jgi:hypothetical protein
MRTLLLSGLSFVAFGCAASAPASPRVEEPASRPESAASPSDAAQAEPKASTTTDSNDDREAGRRPVERKPDADRKPENEKPAPTAKSSLSASSMTVDGTSFASLTCDLGGGGGLLGPIAIAKGVSLQKSALDACVKKPTETPIEVTSSAGTFAKVKATGPDASVNRCVERALKGKQAAIAGTCSMTVQHGR